MTVKLYKDGNHMGIWTDASDEHEFLSEIARTFDGLIAHGWCVTLPDAADILATDWEFQFNVWLPQIVEICLKYRGYKSDVNVSQTIYCGNIEPKDYLCELDRRGWRMRETEMSPPEVSNGNQI